MSTSEEAERLVAEWRLAGTPTDERLTRMIAAALDERDAKIAALRAKLADAARDAGFADSRAELDKRYNEYAEGNGVFERALQDYGSALDEREKEIANLRAKLAEAEQRARDAEVKGLEKAKAIFERWKYANGLMDDINAEIARLKGEKGEG